MTNNAGSLPYVCIGREFNGSRNESIGIIVSLSLVSQMILFCFS